MKKELELKGFQVFVPQLPKSEEPRINNWVLALTEYVKNPDQNTYFIGHSMGCQAIVRYLERLADDLKIGGVIFVAGFFKRLTSLEDEDLVKDVAAEWLGTPLDFEKVKKHCSRSTAIFSDDDPYVPLDNQDDFKNKLGSKIIIESGMGHFSGERGMLELLVARDELLTIAK